MLDRPVSRQLEEAHFPPPNALFLLGKAHAAELGRPLPARVTLSPAHLQNPVLHEPTSSALPGATLRRLANLPSSPDAAWKTQPVGRPRTDLTGNPTDGRTGLVRALKRLTAASTHARKHDTGNGNCPSLVSVGGKREAEEKKKTVDGPLSGESRK